MDKKNLYLRDGRKLSYAWTTFGHGCQLFTPVSLGPLLRYLDETIVLGA